MDNTEREAKELVQIFTDELFSNGYYISKPMIKLCASICVNETIRYINDTPAYRGVDDLEKVKEKIQSL